MSPTTNSKIFGIGLSRTGTLSLTQALGYLGFHVVHFPEDVITYSELHSGVFDLTLLKTVDGITDTPAAAFYKSFDRLYPDSRFILTVRPLDSWLESCRRFWIADAADQSTEYHRFINRAVYGAETFDRERFVDVYEKHHQDVKQHFADRSCLLELEVAQPNAIETLADFLGQPKPEFGMPWLNDARKRAGDH